LSWTERPIGLARVLEPVRLGAVPFELVHRPPAAPGGASIRTRHRKVGPGLPATDGDR